MELREQNITISLGTITKAIVICLLFFFLFLLKDLVFVLLVAIVVASAVEPGAQWFIRRGVPRLFSVILIYLGIAISLAAIVFFLLIPLLAESSDFLQNFPIYFNPDVVSNTIGNHGFVADLTSNLNLDLAIIQINELITTFSSNAFGTVATVFGGILSFFLMTILSFYLSVEEDGVGKFLKAITTIKHEAYVVDLWKRSQRKIGLWMQGQLILAVIIGMLVYLGLLLINVPNALLLAFLAAAFEIIPLFGPILASIPAVMISFVTGGFPLAVVVILYYIVVHQFENQLIYPLVVKKVVGVSPIVSIIALAAGFHLAGFIGLILSVPIAAVIIEFFDDFEKNKLEKMNAGR